MILHEYRVQCDECGWKSREFTTPTALDIYLIGDDELDGKWLVTRRRRICAGCVIDRACRIFGHRIDAQMGCSRCHRSAVAS